MKKMIAFVGAPASGKSTLASMVYNDMKLSGVNVELVPEFIRYDIHAHGPMKSIWEQYRTRQHQRDIEDAIPQSAEYAVIDSSTLLPFFYACLYADQADARQRLVLHDMYRYMLDDLYLKRYHAVFYLPVIDLPSLNFEDGVRFQDADEIATLDTHMNLAFTKLYRPGNIFQIDGPYGDRLGKVNEILGNLKAE